MPTDINNTTKEVILTSKKVINTTEKITSKIEEFSSTTNDSNSSSNESRNTQSTTHEKVMESIKLYLGIPLSNDIIKEIMNYAKSDIEKFIAILVSIFTISFLVLRSIGYSYQSGAFSVYHINKCYIELGDNFLFQIIQYCAIAIIFLFVNYIFISIWKTPVHFIKKIIYTLLLFIFEMLPIFITSLISSNTSLPAFHKEVTSYSTIQILILLILLIFFLVVLHVFGIIILFSTRKSQNLQNENGKTNNISIITLFASLLLTAALALIGAYSFGIIDEQQRTSYKLIETQVEYNENIDKPYIFKNINDKTAFVIYPIIYENQDIYIVARLYQNNNIIRIDSNYQNIIEKENTEIVNFDEKYQLNHN